MTQESMTQNTNVNTNTCPNMFLNYLYLSISLWSTFSYAYDYEPINSFYMIGTFCLFDLLFIEKTKDMIIHHTISLLLCKYIYNYSLTNTNTNTSIIIHTGLSCEISSIFLITKNIIRPYKYSNYHTVNDILFIGTFFYFSLYNFIYILLNDETVNNLLTNGPIMDVIKLNIIVYGLLLLNLYWMRIILLKVIKTIGKTYFNLEHFY
uniref:TLC domain-containing protein n=1 Tax=viral metagenome TaxID=1070528 RepID=A0A6C0ETP3_9ZZZZ